VPPKQKAISVRRAIFKSEKRSADYYVAGLALFFDLFPTCCRQPDLYPLCGGKEMESNAFIHLPVPAHLPSNKLPRKIDIPGRRT
jgi:hypothetical protein